MKVSVTDVRPMLLHDGIYFDVIGRASFPKIRTEFPFKKRLKSSATVERALFSLTKGVLFKYDENSIDGFPCIDEKLAAFIFGEEFIQRLKVEAEGRREYKKKLRENITFSKRWFEVKIQGGIFLVLKEHSAKEWRIVIKKGNKICYALTIEEEEELEIQLKKLWIKRGDIFPEVDLHHYEYESI